MPSDSPHYQLTGGDVSSDAEVIKCPSCERATEYDLPEFDCSRCGETIAFVVAEKRAIPGDLADWVAVNEQVAEFQYTADGAEELAEEARDLAEEAKEMRDGHEERITALEESLAQFISEGDDAQ